MNPDKKKQVETAKSINQIQLYCTVDDFGDFITGLLGKPQSISKAFRGSFEINQDHVQDLHLLLTQRISQQNKAKLIQFTAKIVFNDNSSILINSIEEFMLYREIRAVSSEQLHLSWSFLVEFQDKKIPEKQDIDISFIAAGGAIPIIDDDVPIIFSLNKLQRGLINFRIRHTARTWGADIEALLSGHIKNILDSPNRLRDFIWRKSGIISFSVAVLYFIISLVVSFWTASCILSDQNDLIERITGAKSNLEQKIDFILSTISTGIWANYYFAVIIFLIISIVISVCLAIWTEKTAEKSKPSFVNLTEQTKKIKEKLLKKYKNSYISFFISIVTAIITSLIANILFHYFWK